MDGRHITERPHTPPPPPPRPLAYSTFSRATTPGTHFRRWPYVRTLPAKRAGDVTTDPSCPRPFQTPSPGPRLINIARRVGREQPLLRGRANHGLVQTQDPTSRLVQRCERSEADIAAAGSGLR